MRVLLLASHRDNELTDGTAKAMRAALRLGGEVDILVAGSKVRPAAEQAAHLQGARKVLVADHPRLAGLRADIMQDLIVPTMGSYQALLAPATTCCRDILPRVAAALDVMQISDIVAVNEDGSFDRPIYAGNALQTVRSRDPVLVATVRETAFAAVERCDQAVTLEPVPVPEERGLSEWIGETASDAGRPDLASARRVVAGGRGIGSEEKFNELVEPLADRLGAAIGASRAAVDAGYATNDCQVGQTGRIVAPELYIAIGISGAIQHLAGIKDASVIVAINADAEAQIFDVADYGLVGDLFALVPELTQALGETDIS